MTRLLPGALALLVLAVGIISTLSYYNHVQRQQGAAVKSLLSSEADRIQATVANELAAIEVVMRGLQGFFHGSEEITYEEFRRYTSALDASGELRGVEGIAYAVPLSPATLGSHLEAMRNELGTEVELTPPGARPDMAVITYIEPPTGANLEGIGFDIFTNPMARRGAELARDAGQLTISPPLRLIQDAGTDSSESRSFVMYLPVYRMNGEPDTMQQRRATLRGWVDVPFRMDDFMAGLESAINPAVDLEVMDLTPGEEAMFLYERDGVSHEQRSGNGETAQTRWVDIGFRRWQLNISSTPAFQTAARGIENNELILMVGGALTLSLAMLVFLVARARNLNEQKAIRMKALYQALSETNQAIVRMDREEQLFPLVCRFAVEYGDMSMAWVGVLDENTGDIKPTASFGKGTAFLDGMELTVCPETPKGQGPSSVAIRTNTPQVINAFEPDPRFGPQQAERVRHFNFRSVAAFPIQRGGRPVAVLAVHHQRQHVFDDDVVSLLTEMSSDISFALDNFDREAQRCTFEKALGDSEAKLSAILENVGASIYVKDLAGRYTYINQHALDLLGLEAEAVLGSTDDSIFDAATVRRIRELDNRVLEQGEELESEEIDTFRTTGETRIFWSIKMPLRDAEGRIHALCGISTDITERRAGEEQIRYLSNYDALTGLPNRELLQERSKIAFAEAKAAGRSMAILCIDLDRFKIVNDSLGYNIGDDVLREMARRLSAQLPREAVLCRMGADDFLLLLPDVDETSIRSVARELLAALALPLTVERQQLTLTASIGIAMFPAHARSMEQLVQSADAALVSAKTAGRNTFALFTPDMRDQVNEILMIENELRGALEKEQLVLYYQPQVDIVTGSITGVEALIRWEHPVIGFISPGRFIPVAEESGLIAELDLWVMRTAARQQAIWQLQGLSVPTVAVNLSAIDLYQNGFTEAVAAVLEENALSPEMLELELTESISMEHSTRTMAVLGKLHAMGVSLAIDDFGTGYSSLSYLKRYPIRKLKIDKSFIDGVGHDPEDQAIVKAIIGMARGLGFRTLAEGVETREQLDFLRGNGCDEYQGYYFCRPLPAHEILDILMRRSEVVV